MSQNGQVKGHAHKMSVADAATLFGSVSDDPFASFNGPQDVSIPEEAAEAPIAYASQEPQDPHSLDTPMAPKVALPEVTPESLNVPQAEAESGDMHGASPTALFAGTSTNDLFPASPSGDWLNEVNGSDHQAQVQQDSEANEATDYAEYQGYEGYQQQPDANDGINSDPDQYAYNSGYDQNNHYDQYNQQPVHNGVYDEQGQTNTSYYDNIQGNQYQYEGNYTDQGAFYNTGQPTDPIPYDAQQQMYDQGAYSQPQQYDPQQQQQQQHYETSAYDPQATYDPSNYSQPQDNYNSAYNQQYTSGYEGTTDVAHSSQQSYYPSYAPQQSDQATSNGYDHQFYRNVEPIMQSKDQSNEIPYDHKDPYSTEANATIDPLQTDASQDILSQDMFVGGKEDETTALQSLEDHVAGVEEEIDEVQQQNHSSGADEQLDSFPSRSSDAYAAPSALYGEEASEAPFDEREVFEANPLHDEAVLYAGEEATSYGDRASVPRFQERESNFFEEEGGKLSDDIAPEAQTIYDSANYAPYNAPTSDHYGAYDHRQYAPAPLNEHIGATAEDSRYTGSNLQPDGQYAQWQSTANNAYETYEADGEMLPPHQSETQPGYFDNVPMQPPSIHDGVNGMYQSTDGSSPYEPANAIYGARDGAANGYATQERPLDAAEERHKARIPLACFTIDGKLLTFFPTWAQDIASGAYGNAAGGYGLGQSAAPTKVTIRALNTVIPPSSYASTKSPLDFPGPGLEVIPNQGSALSRATGSGTASNKAKKTTLIKYLNDAANEMTSGLGYLAAGKPASETRRMQDRILILRLLAVLTEQDGNMNNNPSFDAAIKDLLLADQSSAQDIQQSNLAHDTSSFESIPTIDKVKVLHQMEDLLMAGQRKQAVDLAVEQKLWTHAVVIASGMDRSTWREVVGQFVEEEFNSEATSSLHGVKVAYNLFSGQEPKATFDLFRPKASFLSDNDPIQGQEINVMTSHTHWRKSVATVLANRSSGDSAILTAMGDGLKLSGWIEAAHVCYLLSPMTSSMDGYDGPSTRLTIIGAGSPEASTAYLRDLDYIILTEIFEYAQSLQPIAKGQEPFHGLAYLQSYRLVHAYLLAEMGEVKRALRYCDAITTLLKHGKMNRYYHPVLLQHLQELSHRLQGDTKGSKWTQKKPTMDGVWGALEGRFTKFIAGEDEASKDSLGTSKVIGSSTIGPFSHYSSITPDARSGGVSRVQSMADFNATRTLSVSSSQPQSRPGSALEARGSRAGVSPLVNQSFRAESVSENIDYSDWATPIASAQNPSARSSPKLSIGQQSSSDAENYGGPYTSHANHEAPWYAHEGNSGEAGLMTSIDGPYYGYRQPHGAIQSQFVSNVDQDLSHAMNNATIDDEQSQMYGNAPTPGPMMSSYAPSRSDSQAYEPKVYEEEDDEDLGFGNSRSKRGTPSRDDRDSNVQDDKKREAEDETKFSDKKIENSSGSKPGELKPAASWFGRLWKRDTNAEETKAKKAHLGEEVSFYYDKDLKRWVNKKAGDSGQTSATPPPPPRAQTASPSPLGSSGSPDAEPRRVFSDVRPPPAAPSAGASQSAFILRGREASTPPIREASEQDDESSDTPSRPSVSGRSRSNLADHSQPPALQPNQSASIPIRPATTDGGGGPPRAVSGSAIKKKPISKRYVRVD